MLSISHNWPGVSCSPSPQGLHQPLLPLQLKLKDLAVRQQRCPGQLAFHDSNAAREYQQAVTVNGQEKAQHQLQLRLKHYGVRYHHLHNCMLMHGVQGGPDCGQGRKHTENEPWEVSRPSHHLTATLNSMGSNVELGMSRE